MRPVSGVWRQNMPWNNVQMNLCENRAYPEDGNCLWNMMIYQLIWEYPTFGQTQIAMHMNRFAES